MKNDKSIWEMHVCKVFSQISLRSVYSLLRDDNFLFLQRKSLFPVKAVSFVPYKCKVLFECLRNFLHMSQ